MQQADSPPPATTASGSAAPAAAPRPTTIAFDGTFAVPDAGAFYLLRGLLPAAIGSGQCGTLRADREQLSALLCAASRQLGGSAAERQWPEEYQLLRAMDGRLTAAGCVAATSDPCSRVATRTDASAEPMEPSEPAVAPLDLLEWSRSVTEADRQLAVHLE